MPCYVKNSVGLKVCTSYPNNRNTNIPVTQAMVQIFDINNGKPLAIINGTLLTAIKTGAVSGVGMKYLRPNAKSVGLVGTGLQGLYQIQATLEATTVETVYLYNRSPEKVNRFVEEVKEIINREVSFVHVSDIKDLVTQSEIIITATTSLTPVLPDEDIYEGKLIFGVGSYKENMRELPEKLFRTASRLYTDSLDGINECGDIIDPLKNGWIDECNIISLSEVVCNNEEVPTGSSPIVFKNISMALFDTLTGSFVYEKALKEGHGIKVNF